jgi:hypothetical protein
MNQKIPLKIRFLIQFQLFNPNNVVVFSDCSMCYSVSVLSVSEIANSIHVKVTITWNCSYGLWGMCCFPHCVCVLQQPWNYFVVVNKLRYGIILDRYWSIYCFPNLQINCLACSWVFACFSQSVWSSNKRCMRKVLKRVHICQWYIYSLQFIIDFFIQ